MRSPRRLRALAALLLVGLALAGCRDGAVDLALSPEVGETLRYRYEIEATIVQSVDGQDPETSELDLVLDVRHRVRAVEDDVVVVDVQVRRPNGPTTSGEARLDRYGGLAGVDLEGTGAGGVDVAVLEQLLSVATLPRDPVAPGGRWAIDGPAVTGEGRLRRLFTVEGRPVADVEIDLRHHVEDVLEVSGSRAYLSGEVTAEGRTTYRTADGTVERSEATAQGSVELTIAPPQGVTATPASGTVRYSVRVVVTRPADAG